MMSRSATVLLTLILISTSLQSSDDVVFRCPDKQILTRFRLDRSDSAECISDTKCLPAPGQPICKIRVKCADDDSYLTSFLIHQGTNGRRILNLGCCRNELVKMIDCRWVSIDSMSTQLDTVGLRNMNLTAVEICRILPQVPVTSTTNSPSSVVITDPSTHKISTRDTSSNIVVCPPAPIPLNGYATEGIFGANSVGRTITFACWPGYNLTGPAQVTCLSSGNWSSPIPTCSRICQPLPSVSGVVISYSVAGSTFYSGTTANFSCTSRCSKAVPSESVCVGPTWTVGLPVCQARCPPLTLAAGLSVSPSFADCNDVGSSVKFSCSGQCQKPTVDQSNCTATGQWSAEAVTCATVGCGPIKVPTGVSVSGGSDLCNKMGSEAKFSCPSCSSPTPIASATCQSTGLWSNANVACRPECPQLTAPVSGSASAGTSGCSAIGTEVKFSCGGTYQLSSPTPLVCLETGKWSAGVPFCGGCKAFPYSPYGGVEIYNTTVSSTGFFSTNTQAKLFCNPPYKPRPVPDSVVCLSSGRWGDATCWPA